VNAVGAAGGVGPDAGAHDRNALSTFKRPLVATKPANAEITSTLLMRPAFSATVSSVDVRDAAKAFVDQGWLSSRVVSHGALTVSGLIALVIGLLMLFHNAPAPYHTSVPLVASIAAALGLFWAFALTKAVQVRRRPVTVGPSSIVGKTGEVRDSGFVFVNGELWRARRPDGSPLEPGERVRVERVDGLTLTVS